MCKSINGAPFANNCYSTVKQVLLQWNCVCTHAKYVLEAAVHQEILKARRARGKQLAAWSDSAKSDPGRRGRASSWGDARDGALLVHVLPRGRQVCATRVRFVSLLLRTLPRGRTPVFCCSGNSVFSARFDSHSSDEVRLYMQVGAVAPGAVVSPSQLQVVVPVVSFPYHCSHDHHYIPCHVSSSPRRTCLESLARPTRTNTGQELPLGAWSAF